MPDDAIERARIVLADVVGESAAWTAKNIRNNTDAGGALPVATADALRAMLAFASQLAPEGWRERVRHLDLALSDGIDAAASAPAGHRIQMLAATIRDARLTIRAMLDAAPSVTLGEVG